MQALINERVISLQMLSWFSTFFGNRWLDNFAQLSSIFANRIVNHATFPCSRRFSTKLLHLVAAFPFTFFPFNLLMYILVQDDLNFFLLRHIVKRFFFVGYFAAKMLHNSVCFVMFSSTDKSFCAFCAFSTVVNIFLF